MESFGTMNQGPSRPRKQGGPWTNAENERLQHLVGRFVNKSQVHWVEIARDHGTRDAKQCRERWDNHLKPGLNREKIGEEEGAMILKWVEENGKHWAPLGRLVNRPENMVKNYYYQEHKKNERGVRHRGQESRRRSRQASSVSMSRNNSSASSHDAFASHDVYGTRSSMSPIYAPAAHDYRQQATPHYPVPHYASYQHQSQYQSRRTSNASIITNPPSLTSDHGSPAESPRASAEMPYPPGQFALPAYQRYSTLPKLISPRDVLEGAGHGRTNSQSSYGSVTLPHSPDSLSYHHGFSTPIYGDAPQRNSQRHATAYAPTAGPSFHFQRQHDLPSEARNPEARDTRISISSLID
ncbi:hypothetical protein Daus18300_006769 [Diaporthe australafricana]|uniref:Uncharacterized protein n=1 Tax=Diaporthe australafricana TaxID=127596 RepID=A0ABR3WRZ8_9PEZI